jgi:type III restriction enzyme
VQTGVQQDKTTSEDLKSGEGFKLTNTDIETHRESVYSSVKYDLVGKIAESVLLTRATVVAILMGINAARFGQFKKNPENFISEAIRLINEQKATTIVEHLTYNPLEESYGIDIFTETQFKQDFSKAGEQLKRHIYDYVITDSKVEREFVKELDTSSDVEVYAKLPRGFFIPTPVGNYNPDWAISFKEGSVKHIYFVAETKGSMSSMELREIEKSKIECAKKFFGGLNKKIDENKVKYDVVNSFGKLMQVVN